MLVPDGLGPERAVIMVAAPGGCTHYHNRMWHETDSWTPSPLRATVALVMLLAAATPEAADVYRWTDEQGRVHYGQRPPPQGAEKMQLPATKATLPSADQPSAQRRDRQQRLLEAYEYEREQKRIAEARLAQQRERDAARCRELQKSWRLLSYAGPVYRTDTGGERRYLSEDERAAEKAELRRAHLQACGTEPQ